MDTQSRFAARRFLPLTVIGLSALLGLRTAAAEDDPPERAVQLRQAGRERQATQAREYLARLRLSTAQARRLVPLLEQAAELHAEHYAKQAALLDETIAAFADFARQDSHNHGFTPAVEKRTARTNHRAKLIREKQTEGLLELERQIAEALTPGQRRTGGNAKRSTRAARQNRPNSRNRLAAARRELNEINRRRYPTLTPLGRNLMHPAVGPLICKIAKTRPPRAIAQAAKVFERGTSEFPVAEVDARNIEIGRLRAEINNWNLINGLHLGRNQIDNVVGLYEAVVPTKPAAAPRPGARARRRVNVTAALERAVEQVLNPGQREVLLDYNACLIPPKNLKNPVRIGQASDKSRFETWLTRARKLPHKRLVKLIDKTLEQEIEHATLRPAQAEERKELLVRTVRRAAAMSATEFELDKADLAKRITPPDRKRLLKREIATLSRKHNQSGPIARFMLKPKFIEQLRTRGRQLAEGLVAEHTDLTAGPQAENCDQGCAVDTAKASTKKRRKK
jgi:hypothetical protein